MIKYFQIVIFLIPLIVTAQEKKIETVYFNFDRYDLEKSQEDILYQFIKSIDDKVSTKNG